MQIYVKSSVSNVHHFNWCQWRISSGGVVAEYSKWMFLNTHYYSHWDFCSSLLYLVIA